MRRGRRSETEIEKEKTINEAEKMGRGEEETKRNEEERRGTKRNEEERRDDSQPPRITKIPFLIRRFDEWISSWLVCFLSSLFLSQNMRSVSDPPFFFSFLVQILLQLHFSAPFMSTANSRHYIADLNARHHIVHGMLNVSNSVC